MVSIVTPTYNSSKYIEETYNSINAQSHTNWEWLVTDDCSSDETFRILKNLASCDGRVKIFINDSNSGAAVTRNKSLSAAQGEYVAFLDSDDLWDKLKLEKQIKFMVSKNIDFSFTSYELIDGESNVLNKFVDMHKLQSVTYKDMLKKKATLGCSTVILRRRAFDDLSMPLLRTGQDYAFWLKLMKSKGIRAYLCSDVLTKYRITPNSISRNKIGKSLRQWQIYRKVENLGLLYSLICFVNYGYRAVFRR